jgi:hypothetical protein
MHFANPEGGVQMKLASTGIRRNALSPAAWTFPAAIVLAAMTLAGWILFAFLSRSTQPSCELLGRTAWLAASAFATSGALLPMTFLGRPWTRLAAAVVLAMVVGGIAWWATATLFPRYC